MLHQIHKYFACKRDLHAISQGISCIIFIQLTGVPFEAGHILFIHCINADCGLPLKVKGPRLSES